MRGEFHRCEKAGPAAEFALLLPLMIIILFGMFEGGYYMFNQHKVLKGVRDGARYAARQDFSNYDCDDTSITDSTVETNIENVTIYGHPNPTTSTVNVTDAPGVVGWDTGEVFVTVSCDATTNTGIYEDFTGGAIRVTVAADVPYEPLWGVFGFDSTNLKLKAEAQAAVTGL